MGEIAWAGIWGLVPDKASEDEHKPDNATEGLDVGGVLAATS